MNQLIVAALVLLAAVGHVSVVTAQTTPPLSPTSPPPPPTSLNLQRLPWWFARPQYHMPGMPWFYRPPTPPAVRQCRVASWQQAQFWSTDEWGNTVTWVGYQPQYVCD